MSDEGSVREDTIKAGNVLPIALNNDFPLTVLTAYQQATAHGNLTMPVNEEMSDAVSHFLFNLD